jgi:hypothetical protein
MSVTMTAASWTNAGMSLARSIEAISGTETPPASAASTNRTSSTASFGSAAEQLVGSTVDPGDEHGTPVFDLDAALRVLAHGSRPLITKLQCVTAAL